MAVQLINPFVVPADKEEEFLKAWNETSQVVSAQPGFVETYLHRNVGGGDGTFQYVDVAIWESAEAWDATHGSHTPGEESIPGVEEHPGIFEEVVHVKGRHKAT